nr:hypothetical protein [Tanacetum cinerariifolium]
EAGGGPARHFLGGVVFFAVVLVVGPNGTVGGGLPGFVGFDDFVAAVGVGHVQLQQQLRVAEGLDFVGLVVLPHGVEAAVAEHRTEGIGA